MGNMEILLAESENDRGVFNEAVKRRGELR